MRARTSAGRPPGACFHSSARAAWPPSFVPDLTRAQLYTAIALMQMGFDAQDPQNLAPLLHRTPLPLESNAPYAAQSIE
jgi:hypothetical protein